MTTAACKIHDRIRMPALILPIMKWIGAQKTEMTGKMLVIRAIVSEPVDVAIMEMI